MGSIKISVIVLIIFVIPNVKSGDKIPDRECATLFSEPNFQGETLFLRDFDQSVNLAMEYRTTLAGWTKTGSIRVEDECLLNVCSDTYFLGKCQALTVETAPSYIPLSVVLSVNCTCKRTCRCADVRMYEDYHYYGAIARAYMQKGCDSCDGEYIDVLRHGYDIVKEKIKDVRGFVVSNRCVLQYRSTSSSGFVTIRGPAAAPTGRVSSYKVQCDTSNPTAETNNDTQLLKLPPTFEALYDIFHLGNTSAHPGLRAALKSAENGRSATNVYVVYFGPQVPYWVGFRLCINAGVSDKVWECTVQVPELHLGISAEVRLIVVPVTNNDIRNNVKLMAALDMHLSSIPDLKNAIPNAVIIHHYVLDTYSQFRQKFSAMLGMVPLLLDESNPNVAFVLERYNTQNGEHEHRGPRRTDEIIRKLEEEIRKPWSFPISVSLTPVSEEAYEVNGYVRMSTMEYWPRNLEMSLEYICEKGGDPLGHAILKAYFQDNHTPRYSVKAKIFNTVLDNGRIEKYDKILKDLIAKNG